MEKKVTPNAISIIRSNPAPNPNGDIPELVVQVLDLKIKSTKNSSRYIFTANDGNLKLKGILPVNVESEVLSGNIQNLGLVRILDYSLNDIPYMPEKYLAVFKCEAVSPSIEVEVTSEADPDETRIAKRPKLETEPDVKSEGTGLAWKPKQEGAKEESTGGNLLNPKQEIVSKPAAQMVEEKHTNEGPAARLAMTRRVHSLVSLNLYQVHWMIKVRVTNKGGMRTYKNARGEGCVFNVELTDQDGTQIQATMFNEAAKKFYSKLEMGKVYYISKGTLKMANKQFNTIQHDYEIILNEYAEVEEAMNEESFIPETKFNFVPFDMLSSYVNGKDLVDIVGVVQSVSQTLSIRRKIDNEIIPKRDITVVDDTKNTVVVSLWNDLATGIGQELLDVADESPIVAIKTLKVGDFQGVSLSAISKSLILVNPNITEANKLRDWFDSEGKGASVKPVGYGVPSSVRGGMNSMYSDRTLISHIISDPFMGEDKPVYQNIRVFVRFIKPDQSMWYRACKTCNKKVTDVLGSGFWCEWCQKSDKSCPLRYSMVMNVTDASGEAWVSTFNEEAKSIIGCSADELHQLKLQVNEFTMKPYLQANSFNSIWYQPCVAPFWQDHDQYVMKLKQATWVQYLLRVSVAIQEYNGERKQRMIVKAVAPLEYTAESQHLLEEISKGQV
ncbi:hypothetical protein SAY86_006859 [Trapa natans]|uniref:Replication protein A subunit n=1 Tax=Trapa natans TaxID=22666 RepID=A0AAN7LEL1_TRANT|nr:hypothetical protein SAY86_006859 [Trapa natans]